MSEQPTTPESQFPGQLISSKEVGYLPAEILPWMPEDKKVSVSELVFPEGKIYVASTIPDSLEKATIIARKQDANLEEGEFYSKSDKMLILAAHLEASNQSIQSKNISTLVGEINPLFDDFGVRAYKEAPKPNTRRLYYAYTTTETIGIKANNDAKIEQSTPILIRLALTDKKNQISVLKFLTTHSTASLRKGNAGSI